MLKSILTGKRYHDRLDCPQAWVFRQDRPGGPGPIADEILPDKPCPLCGMGCPGAILTDTLPE